MAQLGYVWVAGRTSSISTSWGRLIGSGGIIFSHLLFGMISIYKKNAPNNAGEFIGFFPFSTVLSVVCFKFAVIWPLITGFSCKSPCESKKEESYEKSSAKIKHKDNILDSNPFSRIKSSFS